MCIDVTDPLASRMNNLYDVKTHMPGFLSATHSWFKNYKIPAGKPANKFAFKGHPKGPKFARKVIEQTNGQWKDLIKSQSSPHSGIYLLVEAHTHAHTNARAHTCLHLLVVGGTYTLAHTHHIMPACVHTTCIYMHVHTHTYIISYPHASTLHAYTCSCTHTHTSYHAHIHKQTQTITHTLTYSLLA